ncbi:6-bladed beta-propeller [Bacteroides helcogenes]|uniref:6-bladed beta-propeller n=1 Tax=Bacteroides helcogenes TaxID=290053 RepID=UPI0002F7EC34|nr:6-bladed beta-propeller [Bacteroides helcogenes]MDY5239829.1 6-bladed beta-propeller [Bacteroides helcogenes]
MKNKKLTAVYSLLLVGMALCGCNNASKRASDGLAEQPVVGSVKVVDGDSLWVCDFSALKDTVMLPLSMFTEDLQIVKLDGRDEALTPTGNAVVSEHHILVYGKQQTPFKLFDKTGKFLCNVGSFGQGPGEYQLIYDAQIDEESDRIYLLPWNARALLAYDMRGQFVQGIPLPTLVPKGVFKADTKDSLLSVFLLPFNTLPYVAWTQNFIGEVKDTISARHLALQPDFSNEVVSNKNSNAFDVSLFVFFERRPDTLYHFSNGRLAAHFTMDFAGKEIPIHDFQELPNHFLGNMSIAKTAFGELVWNGRTSGLCNGQTYAEGGFL